MHKKQKRLFARSLFQASDETNKHQEGLIFEEIQPDEVPRESVLSVKDEIQSILPEEIQPDEVPQESDPYVIEEIQSILPEVIKIFN